MSSIFYFITEDKRKSESITWSITPSQITFIVHNEQ